DLGKAVGQQSQRPLEVSQALAHIATHDQPVSLALRPETLYDRSVLRVGDVQVAHREQAPASTVGEAHRRDLIRAPHAGPRAILPVLSGTVDYVQCLRTTGVRRRCRP